MPDIKMPNGDIVRFPDDMPKEEIRAKIASKFPELASQQPEEPAAPQEPEKGWLQTAREKTGDITSGIVQGLTANFGDEITAGALAPAEMIARGASGKGWGIGDAYNSALSKERDQNRISEQRTPIGNTIGQIGGGLALGGGAAKGGLTLLNAGVKPTAMNLIGRGAAEGAAYGGLYGAGAGEGLEDRATQAAFGAGIGGIFGGAGGAYAARGAKKAALNTVPSYDDTVKAAQQAYQAVDDMGVQYSPQALQRLNQGIADDMKAGQIDSILNPRASRMAQLINERLSSGQPQTLGELDKLRQGISRNVVDIPGQKVEGRFAGMMKDNIDEFINAAKPGDIISGDPQAAASAIQEARRLHSIAKKSEVMQEALEKAKLQTGATGSGGNIDNAVRQQVKSILNSPKKSKAFTDIEKKLLNDIVMGSKGRNALRLAGKLSPQGNGLMAALGIGGAMYNPAIGGVALGGMGAKTLAERGTMNAVQRAQMAILNGGRLPEPTMISPLNRALLEVISRQSGNQIAN